MTLTESWEGLRHPKVGEPISRSIKLIVNGVTADQIPDFTLAQVDDLSTYSDRATNNNHLNNKQVIGERTVKIAYIPKSKQITQFGSLCIC